MDAVSPPFEWNEHNNDIGDWCPWSGARAYLGELGATCPARCRDAELVEVTSDAT